MRGMSAPRLLVMLLLFAIASPAMAGTAYKCIGPHGKIVYQDEPCPASQKQQTIELNDQEPVAPPPAETSALSAEPAQPTPAAPLPQAPLPVLYQCQRATDGTLYTSTNGRPAAYQVPFGILGAVSQPLGSVYGLGGAGASAPEINHNRATPNLVGNYYVWVQDQCRPLDRQETCDALQKQYDENEHKLHQAFKSQQAPFEKREAELQAQLNQC